MDMKRVATDKAPSAIGAYSQAIVAGGLVFCSGQIALDPATGGMVGETVEQQTERVLENLAAVLESAGSGLDRVVKTTVFLENMGDFASMNEVYDRKFGSHWPARATVAVRELPKGALVEIEAVALAG